MSDAAILIGACGWQFAQWQTSFYPESLPEDWQLAFYGNEYPVVLLPAAFWLQDAASIAHWREELAERPVFVAEWVFSKDADTQIAIRAGLDSVADLLIGILVSLTVMPDAAQFRIMRELATFKPLVLDWPMATAEQYRELQAAFANESRVGFCWRGDADQLALLDTGELLLARVTSEGQTPRHLRSLLETLIQKVGDRQAVILFDGDPPDLDVMDQAEVILKLL